VLGLIGRWKLFTVSRWSVRIARSGASSYHRTKHGLLEVMVGRTADRKPVRIARGRWLLQVVAVIQIAELTASLAREIMFSQL